MTIDERVDQGVCITSWYNGEPTQYLHGIIQTFKVGKTGHHYTAYELVMVPAMKRLTLRHNSRIFQKINVQAIIEQILGEMGINDFAFSLIRKLAPREYCVQYHESDYAFVSRLAAEEGIFFFNEHSAGKHILVFSDNNQTLVKHASPLLYNAIGSGVAEQVHVSSFIFNKNLTSSSVQMRDYTFKNPAYNLSHEYHASDLAHQQSNYEHYQPYGRYKDDASGRPYSKFKMESLVSEAHLAVAHSDIPGLMTGIKADLEGHLDKVHNRPWLIVGISHKGTQNVSKGPDSQAHKTTYTNTINMIPSDRPWRAPILASPKVDGPQMAKVVGPPGEEIFCDEHGRVKVQFPWDREATGDDKSSCWVRVSQGWAGAGYGFVSIPRIGHEVIVSFLEGDPDQPIITGRTYHAANQAAYLLPNHKTRTLFKTQTHKGEGSNEIRFEDEASIEQVYLHGQKDLDIVIENVRRESIGLDQHHQVGRHHIQHIGENVHRTVGKNQIEEFGQDQHQKTGRNLVQKVLGMVNRYVAGGVINKIDGAETHQIAASQETEIGANQRTQVNNESYLKAANIILEAGQELTIKGPGGFIKIDGGGITIQGNVVKINEGGSPGKGTAPSVTAPQAPDAPAKPDDPDKRG